jgi:hypothetical protein
MKNGRVLDVWSRRRLSEIGYFGVSGLISVYVTVPNTLNALSMLDWACLAPRPQNRLAEPRSATGYKATPAAASALSTPPI